MDRRLRIDLPIILLLAKKDYVTKLKKNGNQRINLQLYVQCTYIYL